MPKVIVPVAGYYCQIYCNISQEIVITIVDFLLTFKLRHYIDCYEIYCFSLFVIFYIFPYICSPKNNIVNAK